jgi:hypothetical protein
MNRLCRFVLGPSGRAWMTATTLIFTLFIVAEPVLARRPRGPVIKTLEPSKPILEWVIGTVFLIACLIPAFKNSKRSQVQ